MFSKLLLKVEDTYGESDKEVMYDDFNFSWKIKCIHPSVIGVSRIILASKKICSVLNYQLLKCRMIYESFQMCNNEIGVKQRQNI